MIPRSGTSAGEEIGYPLQYFGASLVAQWVKNSPAVQKTWVPSLSWEDPLEKGKATHSSILAWRILYSILYSPWVAKNRTRLSDFHFRYSHIIFPPKSFISDISLCFSIVIIFNPVQCSTESMCFSNVGLKGYFQFYTFWRMLQMTK